MLKFFFVLSLALTLSASRRTESHHHHHSHHRGVPNIMELITGDGYRVENYTVTTSDGYLLDLIRIPFGRGFRESSNEYQNHQYQPKSDQSQSSDESSQYQQKKQKPYSYQSDESSESYGSSEGYVRSPVLLMHGLMSSAEDFVLGGPMQGMAYILANNGYDVYLGNARGSKYGRKHTVLDPEHDAAFWRFCWHDIGVKDLPAMMDKILRLTRQEKLYYIGHMQGSTVFYVMASERPEYNEKIYSMISLGPMAFMSHTTNTMMKLISEKQYSKGWVIRHLGENELMPSQEMIEEGGASDCVSRGMDDKMCENPYFLLNGYNSRHYNSTTIMSVMERMPEGSSTRQVLHFGQLVKSGRFAKYAMGDNSAEDYNLSRITTPIGIIYTPHDSLSSMVDVDKLIRKLPNVKQSIRLEALTNNLDMMYADNVKDIVYRVVMRMMKNIDNNPDNV